MVIESMKKAYKPAEGIAANKLTLNCNASFQHYTKIFVERRWWIGI